MPPALDTASIDKDYQDVSNSAKTVNSLFDQAMKDYTAATDAITKANASRQAALDAAADFEAKVTTLRDDADALAQQDGSLPPAIPLPEPFQPAAPIAARARSK